MNLLRNYSLLAGLVCIGLSFSVSAWGATVKITGSDLMPPEWLEILNTQAGAEGIELKFSLEGTLAAERDLRSGEAELALVAVPEGSDLQFGSDWRRIPLAFQVVVVAVHRSNPVEALTYSQLQSIFGSGGRADQWGEFVRAPAWLNRKINPAVLRLESNISHDIFSHYVLQGRSFRGNLLAATNRQTVLTALSDDLGTIAVMPYDNRLASSLRLLPLSRNPGDPPYSPSADNLMFGDYPLRLPFYLMWRPDTVSDEALTVVRQMLSDAASAAAEPLGLMPLPASERQSYLLELQ